ncbi:uncharacterized protein J3D65DRAFT_643086 [Phyllosticta citribraziliensis]|uniref:NAD(P)-binding protein n=1 Tax=Phyllosticta citribraziliensis TaxID=989973 RepID=A0ABR1L1L8_9PEZI
MVASTSELPPETLLILVTGASNGLGLAFFQHFSHDPAVAVVGIDKLPLAAEQRARVGPSAHFAQVDITAAPSQLEQWAREWMSTSTPMPMPRPIPLVVHSAGVRGLVPAVSSAQPHDVAAAETLEVMDGAKMLRTFEINAVGTLQLVRAVLPNLRAAAEMQLRPKVVVMSSRMGSISANVGGGSYAYRASKAALNAVVKSLSIDVPEVCFASVHPGRVETALVKTREEGAMTCEESLRTMLPVIQRLGEGTLQSGCFIDRFGEVIGW